MRCAVLLAVLATFLGRGGGICVLDNKKGWNVQCGIRDSYLLRLKDYGGFKANFDFGFGLGNEEGFPESIHNTQVHHHQPYARNDETSLSREDVPLAPTADSRSGSDAPEPSQRLRKNPHNRRARPSMPAFVLRPPPPFRRQNSGENGNANGRPFRRRPQRNRPQQGSNKGVDTQKIFVQPGSSPNIIVKHVPAPAAPSTAIPSNRRPTVGPAMGDLLELDANTPADTDHVPSFAAKMFVVREAPVEFNPPGYKAPVLFPKYDKHVQVPRTKFFCEERNYLPGIYADVQLGCKVFHLCLPAAMGNTLTSFMCPNMTLFDQSIMQCNYWYNVNCENSPNHYDANLQMALGYRKINAAQLPLTAVRNFDSVSLLSHNFQEMKNHQVISPGSPSIAENLALKRMGEVESLGFQSRMGDGNENYVLPRGPRMLSTKIEEEEEPSVAVEEKQKSRAKRNIHYKGGRITAKTLKKSPLLFKLRKST